jgi:molybdopterin converting factor small subunit
MTTIKKVSIEFFGNQRVITQVDSIHMPIDKNTAVSDALEYVRSRFPDLRLNGELLVAVNHESSPPDKLLKANDTVSFIPYIGGG